MPIVNVVIAYDSQSSGETYLLVVQNSLCVPTMEINLIPPLILQEAGLIFNDTLKIHCNKLSVEDHSLYDEESGLCMSFTLNGTFSVITSRTLDAKETESAEDYQTVFLTPDFTYCDRYDTSYKLNEY